MTPWYLPASFKFWCLRLITLRTLAIGLLLTGLITTEMRFDWIEVVVGHYLVSTNAERPESGTIWEQGRQAHLARQTLETFMTERQSSQQEARRAASLGQVIDGLGAESGAMLSAAHFVELYLKLPPVLANELMSTYTLLAFISGGQWQRTFLEQQDRQLLIYLLDGNNQVLHRLSVGSALLAHIRRGEVAIDTSLEQLADMRTHIFPAEQFFNALNTFPSAVRKGIIASPEDLLRVSGRIARVGISNRPVAGVVDLGFEVDGVQGAKVLLMQGRFEDVQRLMWALEGRERFGWPLAGGEQP
ncbi:MAG: hypothetical protein P8X55_03780 [Desulfosarcinaceae bacterium]